MESIGVDRAQSFEVLAAAVCDAEAIARIYNHYVLNTTISFEEQPVAPAEMAQRIDEVVRARLPWLVAREAAQVVGFAYASPWKGRCAYRHSAESSVYVAPDFAGRGIGTRLVRELLGILRERSIHVVIAGIALPNDASIALHEHQGFAKVAHFREVGYKFGHWVDVGYWQRNP